MPSKDFLADKSHELFADKADEERAKEIQRLRSMTIEERIQEFERLYALGKEIKRTEEEIAAEEAGIAEVRERWVRLKRAYLGEL